MTRRFTPRIAAFGLIAGLFAGAATTVAQEPQQPLAQPQQPPGAGRSATEGRAPPVGSEQQTNQAERALESKSGQGGKEEPGSHAPTQKPSQAAIDRPLSEIVPKSPQTEPSKFSQRNARLDKLPLMAQPLPYTAEQQRRIYESVSETKAAPASAAVEPAHVLPNSVEMHPMPKQLVEEIPGLGALHYAKFANKVLLVRAPNRIVVGVIEK